MKKLIIVTVIFLLVTGAFGQTNLATLANTSASSTNSSYPLSNLFDGNPSNYWQSSGHGAQWLIFILSKKIRFGTVTINNIAATDNFTIDISNDGTNWIAAVSSTASAILFNKSNIYTFSNNTFNEFQYVRLSMGANQGYATVGEILITEDATLFKSINASGNIVDPVNAVDGNNLTSWSNNNNPGDKIFDLTLTKPIKAAAVTIIALDVFRIDTYLGTTCTKTGAATTLGGTENIKIVDPGTFDKLRFYSTNAGNIITEIGLAEIDVNALSLSYNYDETGNMYYRTIVYSGTKSAKITMRDTIIYMEKESKGVEDKFMHATINVYPNPTSGIIKIEYSKNSSQSILRLQLFSNNGVLLMNKAITDENTLDISNKPSGVYIMNITIDGETHKWTIIKE